MRPTNAERHTREQLLFYIGEAYQTLSESSAKWLSREEKVRWFTIFMAEKAPVKMHPILQDASQVAANAKKRMREDCPKEGMGYQFFGNRGAQKRARTDEHNSFTEDVSGVDSATRDLERECESPSDSGNEEQETTEEDKTMRDEATANTSGMHTAEDLETNIELALTRGSLRIQNIMSEQFFDKIRALRHRTKRDLSPMFNACKKLDFQVVKALLVEHLRDRLSKRNSREYTIPVTCDMVDPHKLIDAIGEYDKCDANTKIHRASTNMRLYEVVKAISEEEEGIEALEVLERYALEKAGSVKIELRERSIRKYREEYQMGRKLLDIAKWFDGPGIVLVFLIAGIGGYAMAHDWNEVHRQFLQYLAPYLPSIRRLVRSFGKDGLADYCRHGYLSEEQIRKIEEVEAYLPDNSATVESDDESEGVGL